MRKVFKETILKVTKNERTLIAQLGIFLLEEDF